MEILAPAGNWEAFLAAVHYGADAVYLGGPCFNARQSAANFDARQMRAAVVYAHLRGKKVYVTVNTLIANSEFIPALDYLYDLQEMGVDAVILQDMGLLSAVRDAFPDLRIHASTQMTVHNAAGAKFLWHIGARRIVLARELAAEEIKAIHDAVPGMELEVFVHGALCFCYSGQCLFSSLVGGRSGNRGRCAQPCRLPYELHDQGSDGVVNLPGQGKYLLSPADLCLIEYLPELASCGVASIKIEGRMKRAEYVAVVTQAYRQVLDCLAGERLYRPDRVIIERMKRIFNRNFTSGHFARGENEFLSSNRPNNRGTYVGRVISQDKRLLAKIKLTGSVTVGDGLTVWVGQGKSPSAVVNEISIAGSQVNTAHKGQVIDIRLDGRVTDHDRVFKTHDQELVTEAQAGIAAQAQDRIPVDAEIYLAEGQKMRLVLGDHQGHQVEVESREKAQLANQFPLDLELLQQKISRLGNTQFELDGMEIHGGGNLLIPFSDINDARRRAALMLEDQILKDCCPPVTTPSHYRQSRQRYLEYGSIRSPGEAPILAVLVSCPEQADVALVAGADRVYLALEGLVTTERQWAIGPELKRMSRSEPIRLVPVLPRIRKPGDRHHYGADDLASFESVMITSWADLEGEIASGRKVRADYTLNIFNRHTLDYLHYRGAHCACLSPELNFEQLRTFPDLSHGELLVHGEIILMQSEYCLLGQRAGAQRNGCPALCRQGHYYLQDSKGFQFPLATDRDCRFYIFNSRTLCMMSDLERILELKPASVRIEARRLGAENLGQTVRLYRRAIDEIRTGRSPDLAQYQSELSRCSESDFTKGHYYRGVV